MKLEISSLEKLIKKNYPEFSGVHPVANLFPMVGNTEFESICEDVRRQGLLAPIERTSEGLLIDGRTRLMACFETGTEIRTETVDPSDPCAWSISRNLHRRHMTASQLALVADEVREFYDGAAKERQAAGGNKSEVGRVKIPEPLAGHSRDAAGKAVGVNGKYVDMARTVKRFAPELVEQINGKQLNLTDAHKVARAEQLKVERQAAAQSGETAEPTKQKVIIITPEGVTKEMPKPGNTTFNRQTDGNIEWASWSWNPVTGCLHGCEFCYAREIALRFTDAFPFGFEPAFYEHRLAAPKNTKLPKSNDPRDGRVFVGSMADLFGKWVPDEWIEKVFAACMGSPDWEYLFLTKWPRRYRMLASLPKAWFGASVIHQADVKRVEKDMASFETNGVKWISLEPMLTPIKFNDLSWCNLVVIGAQTRTSQPTGEVPAIPVDFDWVVDVVLQCREAGVPYYLKPNLSSNPGMILPKSSPGNFQI